MEAGEVGRYFADKAGFEVMYGLLGIEASSVLRTVEETHARCAYLVDVAGLWRITEEPAIGPRRAHRFEFAPFDTIAEVVATLSEKGREAFRGMGVERFYPALSGATVEVRFRDNAAWTISGSTMVSGLSEDDPALREMVESLLAVCRVFSANGVRVRALAPGTPEDLAREVPAA